MVTSGSKKQDGAEQDVKLRLQSSSLQTNGWCHSDCLFISWLVCMFICLYPSLTWRRPSPAGGSRILVPQLSGQTAVSRLWLAAGRPQPRPPTLRTATAAWTRNMMSLKVVITEPPAHWSQKNKSSKWTLSKSKFVFDLEVEDAGVLRREALSGRYHSAQNLRVQSQRGDGSQQPAVTWQTESRWGGSCSYTFVGTILSIDLHSEDMLTDPHWFKGLFEG